MMEYKGYRAAVAYDPAAGTLSGEVVGLRDVIFFEAGSAADLRREFQASIDDYLAACAERGRAPAPAEPAPGPAAVADKSGPAAGGG